MRIKAKLGHFDFPDHVRPSIAKLIVDTVQGQLFNPKQGEPKIVTVGDAYKYVYENCSRAIAHTPFKITPIKRKRFAGAVV